MDSHKSKIFITSGETKLARDVVKVMLSEHKFKESFESVQVGATDTNLREVKELERLGARVVQYNLEDVQSLERAFHGSQFILVIPPVHEHDRVKSSRHILEAAEKAHIKYVKLFSILNSDQAQGHRLREFQEIERAAKERKFNYLCIVRSAAWQEFLLCYADQLREHGRLPLSIGDGKFAPVCRKDVAKGIVRLITKAKGGKGGEHDRDRDRGYVQDIDTDGRTKTVTFTGPELVDGRKIAEIASRVVDKKIEYKSISREENKKILESHHDREREGKLKKSKIEMILDLFDMVKQNKLEKKTNDLEELLDHKPHTIEEFMKKHEDEFKSRK